VVRLRAARRFQAILLAVVVLIALGCAQPPSPRIIEEAVPPPVSSAPPAARAGAFDSASWSALSRAGHRAMRPRRYAEAEQSFLGALATTTVLPPHDARSRASLGNLVRLAAVYHRADQLEDAERLMSKVREHLRIQRGTSGAEARHDDLDRTFLEITRTRPSISRSRRSSTTGSLPEHHDFDPLISQSAERYGLDPALVKAVVAAESNFEVAAVSRSGAEGLMQLMPATSRLMGVRAPFDASENLMGGSRYLRRMLDRYDDVKLALAAYNAGPEAVDHYEGIPPFPETTAYVKRVLRYMEGYRSEASP